MLLEQLAQVETLTLEFDGAVEGEQVVDEIEQVVARSHRVPQGHLDRGAHRLLDRELKGAQHAVEGSSQIVRKRCEVDPRCSSLAPFALHEQAARELRLLHRVLVQRVQHTHEHDAAHDFREARAPAAAVAAGDAAAALATASAVAARRINWRGVDPQGSTSPMAGADDELDPVDVLTAQRTLEGRAEQSGRVTRTKGRGEPESRIEYFGGRGPRQRSHPLIVRLDTPSRVDAHQGHSRRIDERAQLMSLERVAHAVMAHVIRGGAGVSTRAGAGGAGGAQLRRWRYRREHLSESNDAHDSLAATVVARREAEQERDLPAVVEHERDAHIARHLALQRLGETGHDGLAPIWPYQLDQGSTYDLARGDARYLRELSVPLDDHSRHISLEHREQIRRFTKL